MLIKFEVKIELLVTWLVYLLDRPEQVLDSVRGECILAKDMHGFKDRSAYLEVVLDDGNEAVGDDGNVNLYAYRIFRLSPKSFDLEVLLDTFEKQFRLPRVFIKEREILGSEIEVVRVVDETAFEFWDIIDNPSDNFRILLYPPESIFAPILNRMPRLPLLNPDRVSEG